MYLIIMIIEKVKDTEQVIWRLYIKAMWLKDKVEETVRGE